MSNFTENDEPRRYLIAIGSPACPNMGLSRLEGVRRDVQRIVELFTHSQQGYQRVLADQIRLGATSSKIKNALGNWFSHSERKSSDCVVIYYAGHGDEGGRFGDHYLFTVESDRSDLTNTTIETRSLIRSLFQGGNDSPQNVLLILDVCYAGIGQRQASEVLGKLRGVNPAGSGFWIIASSDSHTEAGDGAFVAALGNVMQFEDEALQNRADFLSINNLVQRINQQLEQAQQAQKVIAWGAEIQKQAAFIRHPQSLKLMLQSKREALEKQYHRLSEQLLELRKDAAITADISAKFQVEKQIARCEAELDQLVAKLDEQDESLDNAPIEVFVSYSHRDESLRTELVKHLMMLRRQNVIQSWHDREILPGSEWANEIDRYLSSAKIILLLISPDFLASDYCWGIEIQQAMRRHIAGSAVVIPVVLRPADWISAPFGNLTALPKDGKPVTSWLDTDEAFLGIAQGIRGVAFNLKELQRAKTQKNRSVAIFGDVHGSSIITGNIDIHNSNASFIHSGRQQFHRLTDIFKSLGLPDATFVEPEKFTQIKMALQQPGLGVVVEGPSGIGKTTALKKALEQTGLYQQTTFLSARRPQDISRIRNIESWHRGIVVVDDLHRLDIVINQSVTDYLKYLADQEATDKKLVIVGIPSTGKQLIDIAFDLTLRIKTFRLGKVQDKTLDKMISQGEEALNILFSQKTEIITQANGSLSIAQLLCFYVATQGKILSAQETRKFVTSNVSDAISEVMEDLAPKFGESVRKLALLGDRSDYTSILILQKLVEAVDGVLYIDHLRDTNASFSESIKRFMACKCLQNLFKRSTIDQHLCFNEESSTLVIDDPQFSFYLQQLTDSQLVRMGNKSQVNPNRVFISYSHADANLPAFNRLRVHLRPLEREGILDLWEDTKIKPGSLWRQEITAALDSARVAVLLVSANFLASDFIAAHELPQLFASARERGTTIVPIIVSPCRLPKSIAEIQSVNPPSKALTAMDFNEQEECFAYISKIIEESLTS